MRQKLVILAVFLVLSGLIASQFRHQPDSAPPRQASSVGNPESLPSTSVPLSSRPESMGIKREMAKVVRVVDGDTIEISGGVRVRYIGIDTPETVDPRKAVQCFGREASNKNMELAEGKEIEMEKDVSETDKYGRLLRYIYVPSTSSGQEGNIFVNDYLVRHGFARASSYPPDIKYQEQLQEAEREARENNRGLWSACGGSGETEEVGECQIKGNISSSSEKIYHLPDCPYWSKTVISEEKGERWFCSEDEARSAGWRVAQNCP